jgi:ferredoxin
MLLLALLLIYDGFTGSARAGENLATVAPWVHYRGLVVLALLLAGNLFCAACPFALPRTLAHRLSVAGPRWPKILRGKWVAVVSLLALFFVYEWHDLWASPLLTAWLIVAYFVAAFVLEAIFTESAFCKYVCPLGTFNFVYSTASPLQIGVRQPDVCRTCVGKDCINGHYTPVVGLSEITVEPQKDSEPPRRQERQEDNTKSIETSVTALSTQYSALSTQHSQLVTPGCGTLLFPPTIQSNLDCTLCLDCARACPHDNVGLFARGVGAELKRPDAWPKRWDVSLLVICLAFLGLLNAFGMTPPVYDLLEGLANALGLPAAGWSPAAIDAAVLGLLFVVAGVLLPAGLSIGAAWLGRALAGATKRDTLRHTVAAFAPAFVPIGLGFWIAHYSFHFLIGLFTIVPVAQSFLTRHGVTAFGAPNWALGGLPPGAVGLVQLAALLVGYALSLWLAQQTAQRLYKRQSFAGFVIWALLLTGMMLAGWWLIQQPMEMRGSFLFG